MDQVKAQLAVVLKYGFWIGTTIILLASLGVWFMTTSKLAEESAAQTSKITTAISTVSSVQGELPTLPNEHSHQEMNRMIGARQDEVLKSWKTLYERQRGILTWPVKELRKDFVEEFEHMIPIETHVAFPTDEADEKETTLRNRYARYIKNVLPSIAEICSTKWTAEFENRVSADMGMGMGMEMDYGMSSMAMRGDTVDITGAQAGPLVKWSTGSQDKVLGDLFPWRGSMPSTLEVYYSQENIWILKQLLQIVDDVNGEATQPYEAKIHEIRSIGIGKSVKFGAGNISKPGARASAMGSMDMGMDMEMDMMGGEDMYAEMGGGMDMGGMGTLGVALDPAENRYVNTSLEPITGATLRSALTSNSPSDASIAVAKRVPVMMSLNMDQRAVHELLAVCGSAPLMVEVKHVRLLPKGSTASFGGGGMMGGMEDEMMEDSDMGGMGMGGMGMGGMGMGGMGGGGLPGQSDEFPLDMSVELYGLIYMYNPPDPVKLGVEQVTEDTVIDGETIGGEKVTPTTPQTPDTGSEAPPVAAASTTSPPAAMLPVAQP